MANELVGIDYGGAHSGIVHANRLVLAGSEVVSDLVMVSNEGSHTDFSVRTVTMDDQGQESILITDAHGFWFRSSSARQNTFHALLQQEGLLFFGDQGEATIPPGPFSQNQVVMRENSWYGSDVGRSVLIVGGQAVFVQTGGRDIRTLNWTEEQRKYEAHSMLSLAGDVFDLAADITYVPSTGKAGETVIVIDTEGNAAVGVLAAGRPIPAWSTWSTGPEGHRILAGTSPRGRTTFLVDRENEVALEILGPDEERLDCQVRLEPGGTLPSWMEGLDGTVLAIRLLGQGTEEPGPEAFTVTAGRPVASGLDQTRTMLVGLPYTRILETTQFVKRTQTGTSGRVRPARIVDAAVDFVKPDRFPLAASEWLDLRAVQFSIVPYSRRGRRRRLAGKPPRRDTEQICRIRYPCRLGWRDRLAVELRSTRHVEIVGIAYRAAA